MSYLSEKWRSMRHDASVVDGHVTAVSHNDQSQESKFDGAEVLEPRVLLSATISTAIDDINVLEDATNTTIALSDHFTDEATGATFVRFDTNFGIIDIALFDNTPLTKANFLNYVTNGSYIGSFIHRSMPGFVIQGGGYFLDEEEGPQDIETDDPVDNEPVNSNVRKTMAMAKLGGDPDSATSQWFFNLADNNDPDDPNSLDNQNGGFTAFAIVVGDGMDVVDAIAALDIADLGGAFSDLPYHSYEGGGLTNEHLVLINGVEEIADPGSQVDLIYSIESNSNNALVEASIVNGELVLDYKDNQYGTAVIEIQGESYFDGSIVTETITVTVDPVEDEPILAAAIADQEIVVGFDETIDLSLHFIDAETPNLTYSIIDGGDGSLVTATIDVDGKTLILQADAVNVGQTVVTVQAEDESGLTKTTDINITVKPDVPEQIEDVPDQKLKFDQQVSIDMSLYLNNAAGSGLTYTILDKGDSSVATAVFDVDGKTLILQANDGYTGNTTITIQAEDVQGNTETAVINVRVSNYDPTVTPVPNQVVGRNSTTVIDLSEYFSDQEDEDLTYTVEVADNDPLVVTATVDGNELTLVATDVADDMGTVTVTVTATDSNGNEVSDEFEVTVSDNEPTLDEEIEDVVLKRGESTTIDFSDYFSDIENVLTYAISDFNQPWATLSLEDGVLTIVGATDALGGPVDVTVTATDSTGHTVQDTFSVTVDVPIPDQTVKLGGNAPIVLKDYFNEQDGEDLIYTVSIADNDPAVVITSDISAGILLLVGTSVADDMGTVTVTVTMEDGDGNMLSKDFTFTVSNTAPTTSGIDDFLLDRNDTKVFVLADHFDDAEDITLTYSVEPGYAQALVTVNVASGLMTVSGVANSPGGQTDITVTATDLDGNSVSTTFTVTINDEPTVSNVPPQVMYIDDPDDDEDDGKDTKLIDLSDYFSDTEDDSEDLTYVLDDGGDGELITVTLVGSELTIETTNLATGSTEVTVTATDSSGQSISTVVPVTVINRGLEATQRPDTLEMMPGETLVVDLEPFFRDPENLELTYSIDNAEVEDDGFGNKTYTIDNLEITFDGTEMTIKSLSVQTGFVTLMVRATDPGGETIALRFNLLVGKRILLTSGMDTFKFTDADGTPVTVKFSSFSTGQAYIILDGNFIEGNTEDVDPDNDESNYILTYKGRTVTLTGNDAAVDLDELVVNIGDIVLVNNRYSPKLTISTGKGGDNVTTVDDIAAPVAYITNDMGQVIYQYNQSITSISGKNVDLEGNIDITGGLFNLQLRDIANNEINIGSTGNNSHQMTFTARRVEDASLTSFMRLKSLQVEQWLDSSEYVPMGIGIDVDSYAIYVPSIDKINVKGNKKEGIAGDFEPSVLLFAAENAIKSASINGTLRDGGWLAAGAIGSVNANAIENWYCESLETIKSVSSKGDLTDSRMIALSLNNLSVKGDMVDTRLTLVQEPEGKATALGKASINGEVQGGVWDIEGHVGSVSAGAFTAGTDDWDFDCEGDVKSISSKGDLACTISANLLNSLSVKGNMVDVNLELKQAVENKVTALGKANINGEVQGGVWDIAGHVGTVSAGAFVENASVWSFDAEGDVKSISSKGDLTGTLSANSLNNLSVKGNMVDVDLTLSPAEEDMTTALNKASINGEVQGGTWEIDGHVGSVSAGAFVANATDWSFSAEGDVKSISSKGDISGSIEANLIKKLSARGNAVNLDLSLTQEVENKTYALGGAKINGEIQGGEWNIDGHVGSIAAAAFVEGDDTWLLETNGDVKAISSKGDIQADISANLISSLSAKGDLVDSQINLTQEPDAKIMALNKLSVNGAIDNSQIDSPGNFGSLTAMQMVNGSSVKAGIGSGAEAFPTNDDADEFDQECFIKSLTLKGSKTDDAFSNSVIAAWRIDKLNIKEVTLDNADTPFGVTADSIGTITLYAEGQKVSGKNIEQQADFDSLLNGINLDDVEVRLL